MSDHTHKTPGGAEFYLQADDAPGMLFAVVRVSGEYSGISWYVDAIAPSLAEAMAWIDRNPLRRVNGDWPVGYEIHPAPPTSPLTRPALPQ